MGSGYTACKAWTHQEAVVTQAWGQELKPFLNPKREEVESEPGRKAMLRPVSASEHKPSQSFLPAFPYARGA